MALLKLKCTQCSSVFEELAEYENIGQIVCPDCGGGVERAYEGKALFGQIKNSAPAGCGGCAHGAGCPHAMM